jgi:Methyltransferase domain
VRRFAFKTDPMATDPGRWGHSLLNLAELIVPCLEAAAPRSVIEIGAYAGDVTELLLDWAEGSDTRITSIDPDPQNRLVELAEANERLELVRRASLEALPELPPADAVIVDGDHNYYTVSEELRLIAEQAGDGPMPLLLCHDVCWPHARRDAYYAPERIPAEHRQPTVEGGYVYPGESGLKEGGLVYRYPARTEGGPRNGVLTAIEDFRGARDDLEFAIVPAFFGLGVLWPRSAPYAEALGELLGPWDRNPVIARLEENRALHLSAWQLEGGRFVWCHERSQRKDAVLRKLLESGTFALAVAVSRLRQGGKPAFSKEEVRRALEG